MRYEEIQCEDAEYLFVAFGSRVFVKSIEMAREEELRWGYFAHYLMAFQAKSSRICRESKRMLVVELNAGQMVEDVRLAVRKSKVEHYGRLGGLFHTDAILEAFKEK